MEQRLPPHYKPRFQNTTPFLFKTENRNLFINWAAGLFGGLSSITLFSPFDLAKTRHVLLATTKSYGVVQYGGFLQTLSKIYIDEGFKGLYKGYGATAVTTSLFQSLSFASFYRTKHYLKQKGVFEDRPMARDMLASFTSGFLCNTLTNPLWVIRTRIQSQFLHKEEAVPKYTGLVSGLKNMCREEGYKSLFKGMLASYMGLIHCVILFPLYENLKGRLSRKKGHLDNFDILIASNISKFVAMVVSYPHTVIRARLQDQRTPLITNQDKKLMKQRENSIWSVIKTTCQREGLKGFYAGLRIDLIRVLPANSLTFMTFEYMKRRLEEALPATEGKL